MSIYNYICSLKKNYLSLPKTFSFNLSPVLDVYKRQILKSGIGCKENIIASCSRESSAERIKNELGINTTPVSYTHLIYKGY